MIDQSNYSKARIKALTRILPPGTKSKIAGEVNETYPTVDNVWSGKQYKKSIVDAIIRHYRKHNKQLSKTKV